MCTALSAPPQFGPYASAGSAGRRVALHAKEEKGAEEEQSKKGTAHVPDHPLPAPLFPSAHLLLASTSTTGAAAGAVYVLHGGGERGGKGEDAKAKATERGEEGKRSKGREKGCACGRRPAPSFSLLLALWPAAVPGFRHGPCVRQVRSSSPPRAPREARAVAHGGPARVAGNNDVIISYRRTELGNAKCISDRSGT